MSNFRTLIAATCAVSGVCLTAPQIANATDQQVDNIEEVQPRVVEVDQPEPRRDNAEPVQQGPAAESSNGGAAVGRGAEPIQSEPRDQLTDDVSEGDDGAGISMLTPVNNVRGQPLASQRRSTPKRVEVRNPE